MSPASPPATRRQRSAVVVLGWKPPGINNSILSNSLRYVHVLRSSLRGRRKQASLPNVTASVELLPKLVLSEKNVGLFVTCVYHTTWPFKRFRGRKKQKNMHFWDRKISKSRNFPHWALGQRSYGYPRRVAFSAHAKGVASHNMINVLQTYRTVSGHTLRMGFANKSRPELCVRGLSDVERLHDWWRSSNCFVSVLIKHIITV